MKEERKQCNEMKDVTMKCGKKDMVCCAKCDSSDKCMDRCYFTLINGCKIGKHK